MANNLRSRFKNAWNVFMNRNDVEPSYESVGINSYYRPDRVQYSRGNERSIISALFTRIAMDVASIDIRHVRLDDNGRYSMDMNSGLNNCLSFEANLDQTSRAFIQDLVMTMLDDGVAVAVPERTDVNPAYTASYDIQSMRVGTIVEWYPENVKVRLYNQRTGLKEDLVLPKSLVAIIENPMYSVINEPNSTVKRLIRKLNLLDVIDEQSSSGKLDMIIQLPYTVKSDIQKKRADDRIQDIERQLNGSKYGIAYADATEHITQLNRSVENNLLSTIQYLTQMAYSQIGITQSILEGTASEQEQLNYTSHTIEPFVSAICNEFKRKFISKTARTQGQTIMFFRDPFKLVPVSQIAEIADKFTRNEILVPNEIRQIIGFKPADDPNADELRNRNISQSSEELAMRNDMAGTEDVSDTVEDDAVYDENDGSVDATDESNDDESSDSDYVQFDEISEEDARQLLGV